MIDLSRRDFVTGAALVACACVLCPSRLALGADKPSPVPVGPLKDFAKDGVTDKFADTNGFFLVRRNGKLYATSAICTHKSAHLKSSAADSQLTCSKHGSRFTLEGAVAKGPAKRALPRFGISVNADGKVIVDPSQRFEQDKWNDPASFVKAP